MIGKWRAAGDRAPQGAAERDSERHAEYQPDQGQHGRLRCHHQP